MKKIPTSEFYKDLQEIYYFFNKELFDNLLPNCLITIQRKKKVMGYFSPNRWIDKENNKIHELALNPSYFASNNFIEIFQTIVHEMCHLWQFEFGKPSRGGYHNKEWAYKMESLGLIPSDTGLPGGNKTGQCMNDYPESGGLFENLCINLFKQGKFIKWFDRFPEEKINNYVHENINNEILENLYTTVSNVIDDVFAVDEVKAMNQTKQKTKYLCPSCGVALWGRANLDIKCNDCNVDFESI